MPARPGRQATKGDLLAIARALGMPADPRETSASLANRLRTHALTVRAELDRFQALRPDAGEHPNVKQCEEGGECLFTPDLEYDSTGQTINCEKCGRAP